MKIDEIKQNGTPRGSCPGKKGKLGLETVARQIAETKGPEYWRSLEELAGSEEFQEMLHREFPEGHPSGSMPSRAADSLS